MSNVIRVMVIWWATERTNVEIFRSIHLDLGPDHVAFITCLQLFRFLAVVFDGDKPKNATILSTSVVPEAGKIWWKNLERADTGIQS